jgi:hydroxyacylglutathione hydrolase
MAEQELTIGRIVSMPFDENTYVAHVPGRDDCIVFDPGLEPEAILEYLDEHALAPAAILCTHGHSDHIAGNGALKRRWPECPLVIGIGDAPKLTDPQLNLSAPFGLPMVSPPHDQTVDDGDLYEAAGMKLDVLTAPGHSIGHVVFLYRDTQPWTVFGGDVLFRGSVGRTDFPDGDFESLREAIHSKLFTLPDETVVLPGHGPATTVGREKRSNPFVGAPAGFVA